MKKINQAFAIVLSVCLLLTLAPLAAYADPAVVAEGNFSASGEAYASVTWRVTDNGVLTIGGTGDMPDYSPFTATNYQNAPYYPYKAQITSLLIEDGVTGIGAYAFYDWPNLIGDLAFPASLKEIHKGAFQYCTGFNGNVILSDFESLTIEADVFSDVRNLTGVYCGSLEKWLEIQFLGSISNPLQYAHNLYINGFLLTSFSLPAGRTQIPDYAFTGCTSLTGGLVIPDRVTNIGKYAFNDCTGLNGTLTLGTENSQLQTIGESAFRCCEKLTGNIVIPDSVISIGRFAFQQCYGFNGTLTLGTENRHLQTIGDHAFIRCTGLKGDLVIPGNITSIEEGTFYLCNSLNGVLSLGGEDSQLQTIGKHAFYHCEKLTGNLVIPDTVTFIGENAFEGCGSLNGTLTIGNAVQYIGKNAFYNCSNLTGKLTIPEAVTNIGTCAFHGCAKNTDILTFFADHPEYIEKEEIDYTAPTVTASGSVTYQVNCTDPSHTTVSQKFITNVTREIPYIYIDIITPTPAEVTLAIGKTAQIGTTVTPNDAMDPTVAFSSDDTNVVTVDNTGLLTAGNPGTATITIVPADGSDHATATVTVTVYDLTEPEKVVVSVDGTASAAATVNPDTAVTPARTYTSSDEGVCTVDAEGNITPVAAGTAAVTVTDGEITKTIPVTVADITVASDKITLAKDETADITVTALPEGTAVLQNITFVSSDETVLTVSDAGEVTALKTGDATVTVTATMLAAGETVTIAKTLDFSVYTPVTSITATAEKTFLDMEDAPYTQITAEVLPEDADNKNVIYTSSDPSVLDVEADGLVIALHEGTATVTITAADGYGAYTTLDFTVTHDLYALRVGPTVEEEETGNATVETNTARRFTVRYASTDPEILEIDPDSGAYTAKKKGTVTVTAELDFEDGGHKTLSQDVRVRDPHEGEFRCKRCDWYDEVKDTPGLRGIIYWMIHTITHFVEMINWLT
ncbi:MAG: leucine-rich repeat protein [Clostridia bacterium]|nr:leucine-rich repeat protein [Clostridia bacterium]